ncbi:atp-dependent helicase [Methylobacterium sp. J-088]|uniref:atp-dependent helicase n=1 Tax=unclassified Methylobacterium TaxID=2615210 RepID=UPI001FB9CAC6|nr:atp-dependent helicase [Methylobacterium sp. J-088]MCJ2062124.1 atp-dependent helicase [Methylobacterium sp. J-088]
MTVTGDEMRVQDQPEDLRETRAKLDAAEAEVAALKVLLALRTHQHAQAWQAARRAGLDLDHARAGTDTAVADARIVADATAAHGEVVARAEARTDAVRIVLDAVLASLRVWGLDRRRFQKRIAQAGRDAPVAGPGAERHAILLAEARRILGRTE